MQSTRGENPVWRTYCRCTRGLWCVSRPSSAERSWRRAVMQKVYPIAARRARALDSHSSPPQSWHDKD